MGKHMVRCLFVGLLLAGCGGSDTPSNPDAPISRPPIPDASPGPEAQTSLPPVGIDTGPVPGAGCDEAAMGEDFCIKNPGDNRGGGAIVTRQDPPQCSRQ